MREVRRAMKKAGSVGLLSVALLACEEAANPPEEFWTVLDEIESACHEGQFVYDAVENEVISVDQARAHLMEGIEEAERASDRIYENEELIPARGNLDVQPGGVVGRLESMHDHLVEGNLVRFAEAYNELSELCSAAAEASWEE